MSDRNIADVRSDHNFIASKPSCSRRQSSSLHNNECMTNVESVVLTQRWTVRVGISFCNPNIISGKQL